MDEKLTYIHNMYPNAKCELVYNNIFQLVVVVSLSAQTTDKRVNMCSPILFLKYPTIEALANANIKDVSEIIKPIGMVNNKAKNIINLAKAIHNEYNDVVPKSKEELVNLPGVGNKTANVVLAEGFKIPAFPVDTHINRIAKRLYYATLNDTVEDVERKLKKKIPQDMWISMHHSLIFFGRYFCKAINPLCDECKLKGKCRKNYK
ncbi:MAG: endonuclease III [Candidatus Caccosoma sp.]|nr:endonuclease III [Candidatus Caccosoma sp.]